MSSDEEYLDSLLKSIIENEEESNHSDEDAQTLSETEESPLEIEKNQGLNDFAIEDYGEEEQQEEPTDIVFPEADVEEESKWEKAKEPETGNSAIDDFAIEDFGVMEEPPEDGTEEEKIGEEESVAPDPSGMMSPEEVEAMFAAADESALEPDESEEQEEADDTGKSSSDKDSLEEENSLKEDLDEIEGMLKQTGDESMTDDDMLALLESMSSEAESPEAEEKGEDISDAAAETVSEEEKEEIPKDKGRKKLFSSLFGGKKKKEEEVITDPEIPAAEEIELSEPENIGLPDISESPKKRKIFSRLFSFLTEADEDTSDMQKDEQGIELSDENRNILDELDKEDKKKKKKKVKGKKGEKEENNEDLEGEGEEKEAEPKTKKKKKKKEKTEEAVEGTVAERKPSQKISPKNIGIIIGVCLTVAAVIIVFSSVIPGFFDKKDAREAYYQADYAKSYDLLYGKKLDNSDAIIFNKSKIILEMNRKLDSYHNYISLGREVEALDALISGVERYPFIYAEAEEYHVTQDVDAIYETILTILADKFGMTEAEAKEVLGYDDLNYTRKLEATVNGTAFVFVEEGDMENGEEQPSDYSKAVNTKTDLLPEEQELLGEELPLNNEESEQGTDAIESENDRGIPAQGNDSAVAETESQVQTDTASEGNQAQTDAVTDSNIPAVDIGNDTQQTQSGSQGELIQGLRQPLEININQ